MLREFSKGTERFAVKTLLDPEERNEAKILFRDKADIQKFFDSAMGDFISDATIHRIVKDVAPSFCRPIRHKRAVTADELFERFYSDVHTGKLNIVLKHGNVAPHQNYQEEKGKTSNESLAISKFEQVVEDSVERLKKFYSRIVSADYHILEEVIRVPEDLPGKVGLVIIDPASVQRHETGWKDWDSPFEYSMFGALKALVVFNLAMATKLSNSAFLAAAAAYVSEGVKCQYNMTGQSIVCKPWYGSYCVRFNLKTWDWELAWVKYKGCGKEERVLVELNRADRVLKHEDVLYTGHTQLFPPFVKMEEFLADYRKVIMPPEKDVLHPIRLNRGLLP